MNDLRHVSAWFLNRGMTLGYDIEIVSASVVSCELIGLSGRSHDQKDSNFKICNIVIPWPMEVLRSKIKRGIITCIVNPKLGNVHQGFNKLDVTISRVDNTCCHAPWDMIFILLYKHAC